MSVAFLNRHYSNLIVHATQRQVHLKKICNCERSQVLLKKLACTPRKKWQERICLCSDAWSIPVRSAENRAIPQALFYLSQENLRAWPGGEPFPQTTTETSTNHWMRQLSRLYSAVNAFTAGRRAVGGRFCSFLICLSWAGRVNPGPEYNWLGPNQFNCGPWSILSWLTKLQMN